MRRMLTLALLAALLTGMLCGCQPSETEVVDTNVTTITMATWMAREYDQITKLANIYNNAQDEIHIELVPYLVPEGNVSRAEIDASLERAYASFITGNTPDLYSIASFDAAKLRNAGLIQDWYPIMQADPGFHMEEYQTHIWELLETDGQLYQLCASFNLFGIGGPAELYGDRTGWTLEEFETFLTEHSEEVGTTQKRMLQLMLWYGVQFDYIDPHSKTCDFESEAFLDWLAFLQSLPSENRAETQISPLRMYRPEMHASHSLDRRSTGEHIDDPQYWHFVRYLGLPNANADGPAVAISDCFALSSTTEKADACWKFVKWLLSYETQAELYDVRGRHRTEENDSLVSASLDLPIRKDLWAEQLAAALLDSSHEESLFYGQGWYTVNEDGELEQTVLHPGLPEEEVAYLRSLVANANRAAVGFVEYGNVTDIVEEEALAYLAGDKTAEECAHLIQERVSIMLAEMR